MQREITMAETRAKSVDFTVSSSVCPHHLGFLGQRPKGLAIPDECLTCEKIIECMASKAEEKAAKQELPAIERTKDLGEEVGEKSKKQKPEQDEIKQEEAGKS